MSETKTNYDIVIVGSGHNGLVAASYLAKAGMSVLVLERNAEIGGATQSKRVFAGLDAKLSVYSYLVSLFPEKIVEDLGLQITLRSRKTASWTPTIHDGKFRELLIRNGDPNRNRDAFFQLTGNQNDYRGYLELQEMQTQIASTVWPSLTSPLVTRKQLRDRMNSSGASAWQSLIEEPLGIAIERLVADDLIRGMLFTDARIGVPTYPHDPLLLQNKCFLYHVIGRGTGQWRVPVGGMGALVEELVRAAKTTGRVTFMTRARVESLGLGQDHCSVSFESDDQAHEVDARFVLCNASRQVLENLLGLENDSESLIEGAGFKVNMLLEKLPKLRSSCIDAREAFAGTVHIDEGYDQMLTSYHESMAGKIPTNPPGEIYCHTLADDSILSKELRESGFHTITLFGLDMPYHLFQRNNESTREQVVGKYLAGINQFLEEPIESCLAKDTSGKPCIEAMSAVDLERELHLPKGNIFHGDLTWPFAESDEEAGKWGVETAHPRVLLCGSAAQRGGAVSGIPGHNAAMKVLEMAGTCHATE